MTKLITCLLFCCLPLSAFAQPELKGSPNDLRQFLYPSEKIVTLRAEAEKKAYSDKAIISLVINSSRRRSQITWPCGNLSANS